MATVASMDGDFINVIISPPRQSDSALSIPLSIPVLCVQKNNNKETTNCVIAQRQSSFSCHFPICCKCEWGLLLARPRGSGAGTWSGGEWGGHRMMYLMHRSLPNGEWATNYFSWTGTTDDVILEQFWAVASQFSSLFISIFYHN